MSTEFFKSIILSDLNQTTWIIGNSWIVNCRKDKKDSWKDKKEYQKEKKESQKEKKESQKEKKESQKKNKI